MTRPKQIPNGQRRSPSESVLSPHQPGAVQPAGTEKGSLTKTESANEAQGIRQRGAIRPTTLSLASVRHRGANPPAIGGTAISGRTNNGTINGTGMHRKP